MLLIDFFVALSLGALPPLNPSRQTPKPKGRGHTQTAIKVLDRQGRGVPGAQVVFLGKRSPFGDFQEWGKRVEVRSGPRGIARTELGPNWSWMVWACWDKGKKRFASDATLVEAGGRARLWLKPFPVPFLRLMGLKAWQKIYGDELKIEWIGSPFYLPDVVRPRFSSEIPKETNPILRLPPLPWNTYYPLFVHKKEGVLGFMHLSPSFSTTQTAQALYERNYPLKRFPLGTPNKVQGLVVDPTGKVIPGVRILLFASTATLPHRELKTNGKGEFQFFLAKSEVNVGAYKVLILHPNYQPLLTESGLLLRNMALQNKQASHPPKFKEPTHLQPNIFRLKWGAKGQGQIKGAGGGTLFLLSEVQDRKRGSFFSDWLSFHLDSQGFFHLPTHQMQLKRAILHHPSLGFLPLPTPSIKQLRLGWALDLADRRRVRIFCQRDDGNLVGRARIGVLFQGGSQGRFGGKPRFFSSLRKKPLELSLFPGTYAIFAHRKHLGFAKQVIQITKGAQPQIIRLHLKEGLTISGHLQTPGETPIPHAVIRPTLTFGRHGSWTEGGVLSLLVDKVYSDSQGEFSLEIPGSCPSLSLDARVFIKDKIYSGSSLWSPTKNAPIRIIITLPDK